MNDHHSPSDDVSWQLGETRHPHDSTLRWVTEAFISPYRMEKIDERRRAITGAVYDRGRLIPASVRQGGRRGDLVTSADPPRLPTTWAAEGASRIRGRWLFGGPFMAQFGHFLTETLTTLWPLARGDAELDGVIFTPFIFGTDVPDWSRELLDRLAPGIHFRIAAHGAHVEELLVPSRPLVPNESVSRQGIAVWTAVSSPPRVAEGRHVLLSRSHVDSRNRLLANDRDIDAAALDIGLEVVHPQELTIAEQCELAACADTLVGLAGSALHLSAVAGPATRVIEIADLRYPSSFNPGQSVIDSSAGRTRALVPVRRHGESDRDLAWTSSKIADLLAQRTLHEPSRSANT